MDPEQLRQILESVVAASRRNDREDTAAIVEAAITAAHAGQQKSRKPNLPQFDPKNIDTWLRRMNAAFDRLDITSPKLKFSHIDEKIPSDTDPCINDYMCGPQTQERWEEFVKYLREKHGKTIEERANAVIEGVEREGRTPSQLWAIMMDRAGKVTLDDVHKQQLIKRLPQDVRQHLQGKLEGKSGKEVAAMADVYFDKNGKPKNASNASNINAIRHQQPPQPILKAPTASSTRSPEAAAAFTAPFNGSPDESDVNAVRFKQGQKQSFNIQNRSNPRGRSQSRGRDSSNSNNDNRYSNNGGRFSNGNRSSSGNFGNSGSNSNSKVCHYHTKFGDKADNCLEHCMMWAKHSAAKGKASQ